MSQTASFTSYARDGFSRDDQVRLRDTYKALDRRGCKLMLSNSDVPFIREIYEESGLRVIEPELRGFLTFPAFSNDEDWYAFVFVATRFAGELLHYIAL